MPIFTLVGSAQRPTGKQSPGRGKPAYSTGLTACFLCLTTPLNAGNPNGKADPAGGASAPIRGQVQATGVGNRNSGLSHRALFVAPLPLLRMVQDISKTNP